MFQYLDVGDDLTFDPKTGYTVWYPNIQYNGMFTCEAQFKKKVQDLTVYLRFQGE